jgi:hypothetical protein
LNLLSPLELLTSVLDPAATQVMQLPERVWVFGGPTDNLNSPPASLRDKFIRAVFAKGVPLKDNLNTPEDFTEWWDFADYRDLLEFECDAGHLSQLIVLFSESAGAWAELGAFANDHNLSKRVFLVIPERHRGVRSFIELGPIRRLEASQPDGEVVCVIEADTAAQFDDIDIDAVISSISRRLMRTHKTESWNSANRMHQLLLLADLADLFQAARIDTLVAALGHFGIITTPIQVVRQAKLLHMLKLAEFKERGTEKILRTIGRSAKPLLEYQAIKGKRFDRGRFKVMVLEAIDKDPQLKRSMGIRL